MHTAAREMVYVAEQGLLADKNTVDSTWQEMLNHATAKVRLHDCLYKKTCLNVLFHIGFTAWLKHLSLLESLSTKRPTQTRQTGEMNQMFTTLYRGQNLLFFLCLLLKRVINGEFSQRTCCMRNIYPHKVTVLLSVILD